MSHEQRFVHLDIRTEKTPGAFGKSSEYIERAKTFRSEAAGVADTTIGSWVSWEKDCETAGIKPIFGLETEFNTPLDRRGKRVTLLVQDEFGFHSLTRIAGKTRPVDLSNLRKHHDGLIAIAPAYSYELLRDVIDKKHIFWRQSIIKTRETRLY